MGKSVRSVLCRKHQITCGSLVLAAFFEVQRKFCSQIRFSCVADRHQMFAQTPVQFRPMKSGETSVESLPVE